MTRRHRGYPYPAHGRPIDYTGWNALSAEGWRGFWQCTRDMAAAYPLTLEEAAQRVMNAITSGLVIARAQQE